MLDTGGESDDRWGKVMPIVYIWIVIMMAEDIINNNLFVLIFSYHIH